MDRRAFIAAVTGGLLAAPLADEAQRAAKVWRVGTVSGRIRSSDTDPQFVSDL
jgi:hypothetical protein